MPSCLDKLGPNVELQIKQNGSMKDHRAIYQLELLIENTKSLCTRSIIAGSSHFFLRLFIVLIMKELKHSI